MYTFDYVICSFAICNSNQSFLVLTAVCVCVCVCVCRRGLSSYFQGKSQSFTSLSDVRCLEDLAKKETTYGKRMKTCRSYAAGLDVAQRPCFTPGPRRKALAKKASRGPCASLLARSSSSNLLRCRKPPT